MITLSDKQLDALKKIVNIGMGKATDTLKSMLDSHIELEVPAINMFDPENVGDEFSDLSSSELASVKLNFDGPFTGSSILVFPSECATKLVEALTDEKSGTALFGAVKADTLYEVGNILINDVVGSITNLLTTYVNFSPPDYFEGKLTDLLKPTDSDKFVAGLLIRTNFKVQNPQVNGHVFLIFEFGSFGDLLAAIDKFCDKEPLTI